MPRKPRFFLPDIPVHIVQRGHSREPVFFEDSYYRAYLDWLTEAAERYQCAVHAYVLIAALKRSEPFKCMNPPLKSAAREICMRRSVGAGGG